MKETGIIMSGSHPVDILEGRKTMTRRVIKPQPIQSVAVIKQHSCFPDLWVPYTNDGRMVNNNLGSHKNDCEYFCHYGQVGDRLWVKETWRPYDFYKDIGRVHYKADNPDNLPLSTKWRSPIFMPRWASRINLEITGLRVERLQEITGEDCLAEGIPERGTIFMHPTARGIPLIHAYANLWDSLNAKRGYGWETNPWVWVIEFKILQ